MPIQEEKEKEKEKEKCTNLLPCPFSNIKCPCGCGNKYSGFCLRPNPCKLCEEKSFKFT
tara:strand:+ start:846 stop:1022 length:177 start_codon:yes stop_codon:yes gene_type:complete